MSEITLILLSMIVPTIVFHMILDKDIPDFDQRKEVDRVRVAMIEYAMDQMKKIYLPKDSKTIKIRFKGTNESNFYG